MTARPWPGQHTAASGWVAALVSMLAVGVLLSLLFVRNHRYFFVDDKIADALKTDGYRSDDPVRGSGHPKATLHTDGLTRPFFGQRTAGRPLRRKAGSGIQYGGRWSMCAGMAFRCGTRAPPVVPGYRATLDGDPIPIVRHADMLASLVLPPGSNGRLVLSYRSPGSWEFGIFALLVLLTLAAASSGRLPHIGPHTVTRTAVPAA